MREIAQQQVTGAPTHEMDDRLMISRKNGGTSTMAGSGLKTPAFEVLSGTLPHLTTPSGTRILDFVNQQVPGGTVGSPRVTPTGFDADAIRISLERIESKIGPEKAQEVGDKAVKKEMEMLDKIRLQKIRHADWSFGAAIFALLGGTIVLLAGAVITFWVNLTTGGAVTSVCGGIVSACSKPAFRFYSQCMDRVRETEKDLQKLTDARSQITRHRAPGGP